MEKNTCKLPNHKDKVKSDLILKETWIVGKLII